MWLCKYNTNEECVPKGRRCEDCRTLKILNNLKQRVELLRGCECNVGTIITNVIDSINECEKDVLAHKR